MKILVGGVNASGKTTLLKRVSELSGYPHIHAAGELMRYLGYGTDYEKLRALSNSGANEKLVQLVDELCAQYDSFLFDSHYLNLVRGQVKKVTGEWVKKFDGLILISAPLEAIWRRSMSDFSQRDRALFPEGTNESEAKEMLRNYQRATKDEFLRLSSSFDLPSIEVMNTEGDINGAAQEITSFISTLK